MLNEAKKRVFSGIQPTGKIHLGNYLGALSFWVENQALYDNIFCIVDLHSLTIPEAVDPGTLRQKLREAAGIYVAAGIDPEQSSIFIQSHVSEHAELAWILNCVTPVGWLERMTQYKSKSKQPDSISTGLLDYPVLQAADILLYKTRLVPVGADQLQHIELARDIAKRFNNLFGDIFVIPEALIRKSGSKIMALNNPEVKMSKSLGEVEEGHSIGLLDPPDVIRKTVMRAVTDSNNELRFEYCSPGVLNLLTIYEILSRKSRLEIDQYFEGKGYGFLKKEVAEIIIETLRPIQTRYDDIMKNVEYIEQILKEGAERARGIAYSTFSEVRNSLGIG